MIIIYKSDDGTLFDNEFDCMKYELSCLIKTVDIRVYDRKGHRLSNIETDETYQQSHRVVIRTEEELKVIGRVQEFMGGYWDIDSIGTWIWNDEKDTFVKRSDNKNGQPKQPSTNCPNGH